MDAPAVHSTVWAQGIPDQLQCGCGIGGSSFWIEGLEEVRSTMEVLPGFQGTEISFPLPKTENPLSGLQSRLRTPSMVHITQMCFSSPMLNMRSEPLKRLGEARARCVLEVFKIWACYVSTLDPDDLLLGSGHLNFLPGRIDGLAVWVYRCYQP